MSCLGKDSENSLKRIFEIIISIFCLVLFSPLLILVMLGIIIFDSRPVFFRQIRVGIGGSDFLLNKFRTMTLEQQSHRGTFDAGDKSRITGIGLFLRKTKLDELPQLWNVLIGDMSIVGPRPEVRKWVDAYPERWAKVLTVKPGITDPASIYYRNEEELLVNTDDPEAYYRDYILPHKLDLYEEYVREKSFFGDIYLILKTIMSVLFPKWYSCHQDSTAIIKSKLPSSK
jgi:lipopolysaccharide/colanic/teichoic acid biosynthesis glycosyltransferase